MRRCPGLTQWLGSASLLAALLVASSGCQTWRSAVTGGGASKQGERQVVRQAKQDPFPSPSDVGME